MATDTRPLARERLLYTSCTFLNEGGYSVYKCREIYYGDHLLLLMLNTPRVENMVGIKNYL